MAQDPNQQSQYNRGYGGYASQPDDNTYDASSQYGQPSDYQQGSQYQGSYQQSAYGQQQQQQQQQYGPYQPPLSAARGASAHDPTSTGLSARNEAVFSYVLGWLSGLVFFLIERKNRFVRFHAAQSFIFFGGVFVVYVVLRLIGAIPFIGFLLSPILAAATFIVLVPAFLIWLFMMFQAYRGVYFRLPVVSGYAESLVERFSSKKKGVV